MGTTLGRGTLSPFGKAPTVQSANFRIPLHHSTGLKSRGFGLGDFTKASPGWFFNPITQLFENAAANEARIEPKGLLIEPATTNHCLQNRSLNTSPWTNVGCVRTQDEDGVDGSANTAWILEDDGSGYEFIYQDIVITANTEPQTISIFIKKTRTAVTFPGFQIQMTGGTSVAAGVLLNTNTGAVIPRTGYVSDNYGADSYGDWWRVWCSVANNNNTTLQFQFFPAVNSDASGAWVATTQGSIIVDMPQFEKDQSFPTSPLLTTTSAVSRTTDAGQYTWPNPAAVSAMLADEGVLICLWTPGFDRSQLIGGGTSNKGIISSSESGDGLLRLTVSLNKRVVSFDGTGYAWVPDEDWFKGITYILALRWGEFGSGDQFEIGRSDGVSWSWGAVATFDGAFLDGGTLYLGYLADYPFHIKNIYFHDLLTQAQIEAMY